MNIVDHIKAVGCVALCAVVFWLVLGVVGMCEGSQDQCTRSVGSAVAWLLK